MRFCVGFVLAVVLMIWLLPKLELPEPAAVRVAELQRDSRVLVTRDSVVVPDVDVDSIGIWVDRPAPVDDLARLSLAELKARQDSVLAEYDRIRQMQERLLVLRLQTLELAYAIRWREQIKTGADTNR